MLSRMGPVEFPIRCRQGWYLAGFRGMTSPVFQLTAILIGCTTSSERCEHCSDWLSHPLGWVAAWDGLLLALGCLLNIFGYSISPLTRGAEINRVPFSVTTSCAAGSFCVLHVSQNCDHFDHNAVKLEINHKENSTNVRKHKEKTISTNIDRKSVV